LPNTTEVVKRVIENDAAVRTDLARGLINVRSLARYVQRASLGQNLSLDAIISNIRRYYPSEKPQYNELLLKHMSGKKLLTRDRIVEIAIRNDPEIPPILGRFSSQIDYSRNETFEIVVGPETTRVIIDDKNRQKLLNVIPKDKVKKVLDSLVEILILLPEMTDRVEAEQIPGVVATISSELAINKISMIECMSCAPDIIILVDQKDAIRTYELMHLLSPASPVEESLQSLPH
jgi:hypothetical protein